MAFSCVISFYGKALRRGLCLQGFSQILLRREVLPGRNMLYVLLEMKQFALKLCPSVSGQDFAQLALVPSWADCTLGKRGEGLWCYKTLGKGERGEDNKGHPCNHKMQHDRGKLSCIAPNQIQLMINRAGNSWDHPTQIFVQTKVWRGWSFTSEEMSKCH